MKFQKALLLILFLLLLLTNINTPITVVGDENTYSMSVFSIIQRQLDNNDHPLLAKTIWAYFVFLANGYLGSDLPVFWRIGTIILSVLTLIVFSRVAAKLFSEKAALMLTIILALDPMYFSFSRLVHLEIPNLFFVLSSLYFLFEFVESQNLKHFVLFSLFSGFALSVKLASLGLFILLPLIFLIEYSRKVLTIKKILVILSNYIVFMAIGFLLGNAVFFLLKSDFSTIFHYSEFLFKSQFDKEIIKEGFQISPAWSFFTIPQIISLYRLNFQSHVETIIAFQNPILFIFTLPSFFYTLYLFIKNYKKHIKIAIICMYFFGLYFPWLLNIHTTYYYYVVPLLPFAILMFAYMIHKLTKDHKKIFWRMLIISIVVFVAYYPLLVGLKVPKKYDLFLYKYSIYEYPEFNQVFCQNCFPRK